MEYHRCIIITVEMSGREDSECARIRGDLKKARDDYITPPNANFKTRGYLTQA